MPPRWETGLVVSIIDGPFNGMSGTLACPWDGEGRLLVEVRIFDRPVQVDFLPCQVERPRRSAPRNWDRSSPMQDILRWLTDRATHPALRRAAALMCRPLLPQLTEERLADVLRTEQTRAARITGQIARDVARLSRRTRTRGNSPSACLLSPSDRDRLQPLQVPVPFATDRAERHATAWALAAVERLVGHDTDLTRVSYAAAQALAATETEIALDEIQRREHAFVLEEVFGLSPSVKRGPWASRAEVRGLVETIRETGEQALWPILADALEDAGCTETELLNHLRHPGPHERDCWAIVWLRRAGSL